MSLLDAAERFASMDRSTITFDADHCLHTRDRYSNCESCFGICPAQAILAAKPPVLNAEKCQTCLACLAVCPVGAYHADDAVASLLNSIAHLEGKTLELLCAKNHQAREGTAGSTGIRLRGCLAGLGAGTYLALSVFGLERILVRAEACSACEWAVLHPEVELQIARAQHALAVWGMSETLVCISTLGAVVERPLWNADNPPLSRRDLFRMVSRQGQVAVARAMASEYGYGGQRLDRSRQRMLHAAAYLPEPVYGEQVKLGELKFAWLFVTDACTACGACARGCPTSALHFAKSDDETSFQLTFSARNCVDCGLCVHVCAPDAITIEHDPTFKQVFEKESVLLQEGALVKCARCGALMAKRSDMVLCSLCEFRRTHLFGSIMPPGIKAVGQEKRA